MQKQKPKSNLVDESELNRRTNWNKLKWNFKTKNFQRKKTQLPKTKSGIEEKMELNSSLFLIFGYSDFNNSSIFVSMTWMSFLGSSNLNEPYWTVNWALMFWNTQMRIGLRNSYTIYKGLTTQTKNEPHFVSHFRLFFSRR